MKKQNLTVKEMMNKFAEMMIHEQNERKDDLCTYCWKPIQDKYCSCCNTEIDRENDSFLNMSDYVVYEQVV